MDMGVSEKATTTAGAVADTVAIGRPNARKINALSGNARWRKKVMYFPQLSRLNRNVGQS
jgi:hypothetical protein